MENTKHILFVCTANQLRSPTAFEIYKNNKNIIVKSAGVSKAAKVPITEELIDWADIIFVMETEQLKIMRNRFYKIVQRKIIKTLDIPDEYEFMEDSLVRLLTEKLTPYLGKPES